MSEHTLTRPCLGWHCDWRHKCKHHNLPAHNLTQYFVPVHVGEFCDVFEPKEKTWGEGKDESSD